jgi:isopentenyl diphosphate isomerase/L-lactate dehydrogenase-like FMN-dependent dehydrogenase
MTLANALSIGDLRDQARRRLPQLLFELIESGVEDERGLIHNRAAFEHFRLLPRYLVDVTSCRQETKLWGTRYASPFGFAPTGFAGLMRPGAELMLARAAAASNVPMILSGASVASMEEVAKAAPSNAWYHLYPAREGRITEDLVRRAADAGFGVLVLTVDNPVYPKRERDTRNGFKHPMRLRLGTILEALTHPGWVIDYVRSGGMPRMENWAAYLPAGASGQDVATFFRSQSPCVQTWRDVEALRTRWRGKLVLKGIQHPDDAARAVDAGIDGIIVSNHGGKSFDPLPSPLETLPMIRERVGKAMVLMLDSGIRRGSDILIAQCLSAEFTFVGRAALYGVAAGGEAGAQRTIDILRQEVALGLALIGCTDIAELSARNLLDPRPFAALRNRIEDEVRI